MGLKRTLTFRMLVFLTINALIGTGIFFATGIAASVVGINSIFSWILAIICSILIALVFAELASIYPRAGGVYEYTKRAFGRPMGFCVGWISWVVSNIVIAMLVIGGLDYLGVIYPLTHPVKIALAFATVLLFNYISFRGIEISGKLLLGFSIITMSVLCFIIFSGSTAINLANFSEISFTGLPMLIPIIVGMFYAIETFFGWESIAFLSEETKEPKKTIPKALMVGTIIVSIIVFIVVIAALGSVPAEELGNSNYPLLLVASKFFQPHVVMGLSFLTVLAIMGSAASWIITTPRLIYAMSKDKVLPESFSSVHKKYQTPHAAIVLQAAITLLVIGTGSYKFLLDVALPLVIFMYSVVILSIVKLRKDFPNLKRTFKVPIPILITSGLVMFLIGAVAISTTLQSIILGIVLVMLGAPLYIIASLGYHEKIIKKISDWFAEISYLVNKSAIEKDISEHITNYLSDITVDRVLDLGCGVGVVTNKIAQEVISPEGKVYGIDFSKRQIDLAKKMAYKKDIKNVEYINKNFYKISKSKKLDSKLKNLDAVVGIGVLGYIDRLEFILGEIKQRLRKEGKIYFVDYDYPGHLLDKPLIEDNHLIYKLFNKMGFKIKIWRQKGFLWTYVHIYGEKI